MSHGTTRESWAGDGPLPQGLIFPALLHSGISETLQQNTNAFNAASRGAIQLVPQFTLGDFEHETFYQSIGEALVARRLIDVSPSNPEVNALDLDQLDNISVKVNRRVGPVKVTIDAFEKQGRRRGVDELSFAIGEQVAKAMEVDWLNTMLEALVAATVNQASQLIQPNSPLVTVTTNDLVDALAAYGDALAAVRIWVMHSSVYYALVKEQIASNITGISNFNIEAASPVTLNRPVLVTDSIALGDPNGSPANMITLGVREGGVTALQNGAPFVDTQIEQNRENLVVSMQGEHSYNVKVKGFAWDIPNAGVNPDTATISTGSNWDRTATDSKDLAAVALETF